MRIIFRETGGFVPIFRGCDLDTDDLPVEEAARLAALVEASGILTLRDQQVPGARDVRLLTVALETERASHRVTFDELSVPPSVRPLLDALRARSRTLLDG
jgi:hypothetical protein